MRRGWRTSRRLLHTTSPPTETIDAVVAPRLDEDEEEHEGQQKDRHAQEGTARYSGECCEVGELEDLERDAAHHRRRTKNFTL